MRKEEILLMRKENFVLLVKINFLLTVGEYLIELSGSAKVNDLISVLKAMKYYQPVFIRFCIFCPSN